MSLTKKDKIRICERYDSLLKGLYPITHFTKHPIYPNFINFDYEPTAEEQKHITSAFDIATELTDQISSGNREDILNFIGQPGFEPSLHVHTRVLNKYATSLEDAILYREVKDTVLVNKLAMGKRDKEKYVKLTKCYKIQLTSGLSFVTERSLFLQETIYELLIDIVKRNNGDMLDEGSFNEILWQEALKRETAISEIKEHYNFTSTEELNEHLSARYGYAYKGKWLPRGVIKLDNRKPFERETKVESIATTFKRSL